MALLFTDLIGFDCVCFGLVVLDWCLVVLDCVKFCLIVFDYVHKLC